MRPNKRKARLNRIRLGLKHLLGGKCALCSCRKFSNLEVDHVNGCAWVQRGVNTETRWYRYLREYRTGVKLRLLCRSCNGRENQWKHGSKKHGTHASLRVVA